MRRTVLLAAAFAPVVAGALALGDGAGSVSLARLSPDRGFGRRGVLRSIGTGDERIGSIEFVAVDAAGRILVSGIAYRGRPIESTPVIARLLPDGRPDTSFGRDGTATLGLPGGAADFAVDKEGRPVLAGWLFESATLTPFVVRLTASGELDKSFADGGKLRLTDELPDGVSFLEVSATDASVFTTGTRGLYKAGVVRIRPDGAIDPDYGDGGFAPLPWLADALAVDSEGRAIVATIDGIVRFDPSGVRDPDFGRNGILVGRSGDQVRAQLLAVDAQDRIVVVGREGLGRLEILRFLASGALDEHFCEGGVSRRAFGVPATAEPELLAFDVPRASDGPYAFSAGLLFSRARDGVQTGSGFVVRSLDPSDPGTAKSFVHRESRHARRVSNVRAVAVSPDGTRAYAAGTSDKAGFVHTATNLRPVLVAVDLTTSTAVPTSSISVAWDGEIRVGYRPGFDPVCDAALRVANDGDAGVAKAFVTLFASTDADLDDADVRIATYPVAAVGPHSSRILRLRGEGLPVGESRLHGGRLLAVVDEIAVVAKDDPELRVAASGQLP